MNSSNNNKKYFLIAMVSDQTEKLASRHVSELWSDCKVIKRMGRIECILTGNNGFNVEDVDRCSKAVISAMEDSPILLSPELDFYLSGKVSDKTYESFLKKTDEVWRSFFTGASERIVFRSDKRTFIRVQEVVSKPRQLVGVFPCEIRSQSDI